MIVIFSYMTGSFCYSTSGLAIANLSTFGYFAVWIYYEHSYPT